MSRRVRSLASLCARGGKAREPFVVELTRFNERTHGNEPTRAARQQNLAASKLEHAAHRSWSRHFLVFADGQRHAGPSPRWTTRAPPSRDSKRRARSDAPRTRTLGTRRPEARLRVVDSHLPRKQPFFSRRVPSRTSSVRADVPTHPPPHSPAHPLCLSMQPRGPAAATRRLRLARRERRVHEAHGGWIPRHGLPRRRRPRRRHRPRPSSLGSRARTTPRRTTPRVRPPPRVVLGILARARLVRLPPRSLGRRRRPLRSPALVRVRLALARRGCGRRHGPRAVRGEPHDRSQDPTALFQGARPPRVGDVRDARARRSRRERRDGF